MSAAQVFCLFHYFCGDPTTTLSQERRVGLTPCPSPFPKVEGFCKLVRDSLFQKSLIGRVCDLSPFWRVSHFLLFLPQTIPVGISPCLPETGLLCSSYPCWQHPGPAGPHTPMPLIGLELGVAENSVCSFLCEASASWSCSYLLLLKHMFTLIQSSQELQSRTLQKISLLSSESFLGVREKDFQMFHLTYSLLGLSRSTAFTWGKVSVGVSSWVTRVLTDWPVIVGLAFGWTLPTGFWAPYPFGLSSICPSSLFSGDSCPVQCLLLLCA